MTSNHWNVQLKSEKKQMMHLSFKSNTRSNLLNCRWVKSRLKTSWNTESGLSRCLLIPTLIRVEGPNQNLTALLECIAASNPSSSSSQLFWLEYTHSSLSSVAIGMSSWQCWLGHQTPLFPLQENNTALSSVQSSHRVWRDVGTADTGSSLLSRSASEALF